MSCGACSPSHGAPIFLASLLLLFPTADLWNYGFFPVPTEDLDCGANSLCGVQKLDTELFYSENLYCANEEQSKLLVALFQGNQVHFHLDH